MAPRRGTHQLLPTGRHGAAILNCPVTALAPTTAGQSQRALRECQDREGLGRTWSTVVSDSQHAPRGQLGTRRDARLSAGLRVSDGGGRGAGGQAASFQALTVPTVVLKHLP